MVGEYMCYDNCLSRLFSLLILYRVIYFIFKLVYGGNMFGFEDGLHIMN